jgi:hypothetical protein
MLMDDLDKRIMTELRGINAGSGQLVVGLLNGDIGRDELIDFGLRLVTLAEHIKGRADGPALVVEGNIVDDYVIAEGDWPGRLGHG